MKILVVDDEPKEWGNAICESLRGGRHEVSFFEGAEKAQRAIREEKPDRVVSDGLIDYNVKGPTGEGWRKVYETAKEKNIPVVVLSTDSNIKNRIREENLTGVSFLGKLAFADDENLLLEAISPQGGLKEKRVG